MEKKKAAKALMVAAALAGGMALGQSFFNEAQATGGGGEATKKYVWCQSKQMYRECSSSGNGEKCTTGQSC